MTGVPQEWTGYPVQPEVGFLVPEQVCILQRKVQASQDVLCYTHTHLLPWAISRAVLDSLPSICIPGVQLQVYRTKVRQTEPSPTDRQNSEHWPRKHLHVFTNDIECT